MMQAGRLVRQAFECVVEDLHRRLPVYLPALPLFLKRSGVLEVRTRHAVKFRLHSNTMPLSPCWTRRLMNALTLRMDNFNACQYW